MNSVPDSILNKNQSFVNMNVHESIEEEILQDSDDQEIQQDKENHEMQDLNEERINENQEIQKEIENQEMSQVHEDRGIQQANKGQEMQVDYTEGSKGRNDNECETNIQRTPDAKSSAISNQQPDKKCVEANNQPNESPFKRFLFWPREEVKTKRRTKERSLSVITSDYWLLEQQKKEKLKLEKEQLKESRKRARDEKQKQKL